MQAGPLIVRVAFGQAGGNGGYKGRIQPTGEENTPRHIRHHATFHRHFEGVADVEEIDAFGGEVGGVVPDGVVPLHKALEEGGWVGGWVGFLCVVYVEGL